MFKVMSFRLHARKPLHRTAFSIDQQLRQWHFVLFLPIVSMRHYLMSLVSRHFCCSYF